MAVAEKAPARVSDEILADGAQLEPRLRALGVPMLLARHETVADKPSVSSEFAAALREFCEAHAG